MSPKYYMVSYFLPGAVSCAPACRTTRVDDGCQIVTTRRHTALAVATVGIALVGMMAMVRGAGVTPPKCGTMPASECTFTYIAPNTSQAYTFNFSSLCSEDGYVLNDGDVALHTYVANICGSTHKPCYPGASARDCAGGKSHRALHVTSGSHRWADRPASSHIGAWESGVMGVRLRDAGGVC